MRACFTTGRLAPPPHGGSTNIGFNMPPHHCRPLSLPGYSWSIPPGVFLHSVWEIRKCCRFSYSLIRLLKYDNKNREFTSLNITKNTIDWLNIHLGRLCHHQEIQLTESSIFIIIMYHLELTPKSYELIKIWFSPLFLFQYSLIFMYVRQKKNFK
jgi:hypothetical protein